MSLKAKLNSIIIEPQVKCNDPFALPEKTCKTDIYLPISTNSFLNHRISHTSKLYESHLLLVMTFWLILKIEV
jgi:hypothetical protein